jgi:hypothetical protein
MAFYGELSVFRLSVSAYFRIQELTECESGSGSGTLFPYNLAKKDRRYQKFDVKIMHEKIK